MRTFRSLLLAVFAASLLAPASAAGAEGGAVPDLIPDLSPQTPVTGGGTDQGDVAPPRDQANERPTGGGRVTPGGRPLLTIFRLRRVFAGGPAARATFRINSRSATVRVRFYLLRAGDGRRVGTMLLGRRRSGSTQSVLVTRSAWRALPEGRYLLRITARDPAGRRLRPKARTSSVRRLRYLRQRAPAGDHRFPIAGPFGYGGPDARFGTPRSGHVHQGQDLIAAEGTPVVAPRGGVVEAVQYQAGGAGHYVVLDGDEEDFDYVFMHLRSGSVLVRPGQRVGMGQRIADVGSTGSSSGAHLHFEMWVGGWFAGGHPVDPLPYLRAWDPRS